MSYNHEHEYAGGKCRYCGAEDEAENEAIENGLAHLTDAYDVFLNFNNLPHISADEHDRDALTQYQKDWIDAFISLWEIQASGS